MTLGSRVKTRMDELGMGIEELARKCGVSGGAVFKVIHNKTKNPRFIAELAEALMVSTLWLKKGIEDRQFGQGATKIAVGGLSDPPHKGTGYHRASEGMGATEEGAEILQQLLMQLRLAHPKAKKFVLSGMQQLIDEANLEEDEDSGHATDSLKRPKKKR